MVSVDEATQLSRAEGRFLTQLHLLPSPRSGFGGGDGVMTTKNICVLRCPTELTTGRTAGPVLIPNNRKRSQVLAKSVLTIHCYPLQNQACKNFPPYLEIVKPAESMSILENQFK